jgi:hypothetical protein
VSTRPDNPLRTLELKHDDMVGERDRLRGARAAVTSQLGPLPASAGIVIGLVGSLGHGIERGFLVVAGVLFLLVMIVSIAYSRLLPYRLLRGARVLADRQPNPAAARVGAADPEQTDIEPTYLGATVPQPSDTTDWLTRKVALEERIYGPLRQSQHVGFSRLISALVAPSRSLKNLQDSFDVERAALNLVQSLFACIVLVLLAGIIAN